MTKEQRLEWLSTHYITADDVKVMMTGTDQECQMLVYNRHQESHDVQVLWGKFPTELTRVTLLLQKAVMDSVGGSYMNKFDHWKEYCKEHKIIQ